MKLKTICSKIDMLLWKSVMHGDQMTEIKSVIGMADEKESDASLS